MNETTGTALPKVTPELLDEAVRRILQVGAPLKIVLFGSHARGQAHPASDLDLLIVEESSDEPRYRRSSPYRLALQGLYPAKDIVVWTVGEIERWSAVPQAFITTILRDGRVLYERPY